MGNRITRGIVRDQRGITGLETAIILIAFVVVASVFAYTVLSAGLFSAQKEKEAVSVGIEGASSALTISGSIIAKDTDGDKDVDQVMFTISTVLGQESNIDLTVTTDTNGDGLLSDEANKVHATVVTYFDRDINLDDIAWTKTPIGKNDGDDILEAGEKFRFTVYLTALPSANALTAYDTFTLEISPPRGASVIISKTIPAVTSAVMVLN